MSLVDLHLDIAALRASIPAAARSAHHAAVRHAALRGRLAELLVAHLLPAAAVLVFDRDEDLLTGETLIALVIALVHARATDGSLVWFDVGSRFVAHADARGLGTPPVLDPAALMAVAAELRGAYDADGGLFDRVGDGAAEMLATSLLALTIRAPAARLIGRGR